MALGRSLERDLGDRWSSEYKGPGVGTRSVPLRKGKYSTGLDEHVEGKGR